MSGVLDVTHSSGRTGVLAVAARPETCTLQLCVLLLPSSIGKQTQAIMTITLLAVAVVVLLEYPTL